MSVDSVWTHRLRQLPSRGLHSTSPTAATAVCVARADGIASRTRSKTTPRPDSADSAAESEACRPAKRPCRGHRRAVTVSSSSTAVVAVTHQSPAPVTRASTSGGGNASRVVNVHDMPVELMLAVFANLSVIERTRARAVCRRWLRVSEMSLRVLRHIDMSLLFCSCCSAVGGSDSVVGGSQCSRHTSGAVCRPLTDTRFRQLLARLPRLRRLQLGPVSSRLSRNSLLSIGMLCPLLVDLDIRFLRMSYRALENLCRNCPRLQHISVPRLDFREQSLEVVLRLLPELRSLELDTLFVAADCFDLLPAGLRSIELKACQCIRPANLQLIGDRCSQLTRLSLSHSAITADNLTYIGQRCRQLTHLELVSCLSVRMEDCAAALTSLQSLWLASCYNISRASLQELATHCTQLQRLNLRGDATYNDIPEAALTCLGSMSSLVWLDLSYQCHVSDPVLHALRRCSRLHTLLLKETFHSHSSFSQSALVDLISSVPSLCHVDITNCHSVCSGLYDQLCAGVAVQRRLTVVAINTRLKPAGQCAAHVSLRLGAGRQRAAATYPRRGRQRRRNNFNMNGRRGDDQEDSDEDDDDDEDYDGDSDEESDERFVNVFADWLWIHNALWGM